MVISFGSNGPINREDYKQRLQLKIEECNTQHKELDLYSNCLLCSLVISKIIVIFKCTFENPIRQESWDNFVSKQVCQLGKSCYLSEDLGESTLQGACRLCCQGPWVHLRDGEKYASNESEAMTECPKF